MRCKNCNSMIDETRSYCPKCGAKINPDSERQERERVLAERATLGRFPLPWIETEYILFYYIQGRILNFLETFWFVVSVVVPLFFHIDFGAGPFKNYLYTFAIFGIIILPLHFLITFPMSMYARKGNTQGIPVLGKLAKKICNKKGKKILNKAALKRRNIDPPTIKEASVKQELQRCTWMDALFAGWDIIVGALVAAIGFVIAYFSGYLG